jgi:hypothetical protein
MKQKNGGNAREFQAMAQLPIEVIYGTHVTEEQLQLIRLVAGKHLLEIGCGGAQGGIAFAKQGAQASSLNGWSSPIFGRSTPPTRRTIAGVRRRNFSRCF